MRVPGWHIARCGHGGMNLKTAIEAKIPIKTITQKLFLDQYSNLKKVIAEQLIFHGLSICSFNSADSIYVSSSLSDLSLQER